MNNIPSPREVLCFLGILPLFLVHLLALGAATPFAWLADYTDKLGRRFGAWLERTLGL